MFARQISERPIGESERRAAIQNAVEDGAYTPAEKIREGDQRESEMTTI